MDGRRFSRTNNGNVIVDNVADAALGCFALVQVADVLAFANGDVVAFPDGHGVVPDLVNIVIADERRCPWCGAKEAPVCCAMRMEDLPGETKWIDW